MHIKLHKKENTTRLCVNTFWGLCNSKRHISPLGSSEVKNTLQNCIYSPSIENSINSSNIQELMILYYALFL